MEKNFNFYKLLIEQTTNLNEYWDLVVITSISKEQKLCYEKQIETKLNNKQLPKQFVYLVLNDPDDCKIGSGGSTLNVVKNLHEKYGSKLYDMKILLIHAGGYSQRMPICSLLGKIFAPIPCLSELINDLFDLKLAIYTPFSSHMQPGIFLASSDDFETFYFDEQVQSSKIFGSDKNDFILIAHSSPLDVAKDHGVYVLDKKLNLSDQLNKFNVYECKTVHQKPSIDKMKQLNIVLRDEKNEEFVFTDSVFYFSHKITRDLLKFYDENFEKIVEYKIEVDAYRDFLQPLGKCGLNFDDYLKSFNRSSILSNNKIEYDLYKSLYDLLKNRNSLIVALNESDFYHLGTINEIFYFYFDKSSVLSKRFRHNICFNNFKLNKNNSKFKSNNSNSCVIKSRLGSKCKLNDRSIIEYCLIEDDIELVMNEFSYLNNCMIKKQDLIAMNRECFSFTIPNDVCMHTVPIRCEYNDNLKYMTIFFNRNDDLKKEYSELRMLKFMQILVPNYLVNLFLLKYSTSKYSIWNLKLFKAFDSMTESFFYSYEFVRNYLNGDESKILSYFTNKNENFYSLFDLLKFGSFDEMISFRLNNELS